MKHNLRSLVVPALVLLGASARASSLDGVASPSAQASKPAAAVKSTLADKPLAEYQVELLDAAFRAGSAMPAMPHAKNRARVQESVVVACLELDQPLRARTWTEKIDGWRRGTAFGELAIYCARNGEKTDAEYFLSVAREIADRVQSEGSYEGASRSWQQDRIRSKIALALTWLGREEQAKKFHSGLAESEAGGLSALHASRADEAQYETQVRLLEPDLKGGNLDLVKNALDAYVQLFGRFYADVSKREHLETQIEAAWRGIPIQMRVELGTQMASLAVQNGDSPKALELIHEARDAIERAAVTAELRVPARAELAAVRWRAGDERQARADLDAALELFIAERTSIWDIYRADALCPIAEGYMLMGDRDAAARVYEMAVEASFENPNARPRAEDLAATCLSMATHAFEPTEELRKRVTHLLGELRDPW